MAEIIKFDPDLLTVPELLGRSSKLNRVLVIGVDAENGDFYGVSGMTSHEMLYMVEKFKYFLMKREE